MPRQNSFQKAKSALQILKKKGELSVEDLIIQFEIAPSTAYNILKMVEILCERDEEGYCEVLDFPRRIVWKSNDQMVVKNE
ncbi:hypothetical protein [Sulfolobus spindle-shaped virus]|nr:hypothetical protein [Sulfolobus spindle-shaped virus]